MIVAPRGIRLQVYPGVDHVSDAMRASGDFWEAEVLDELVSRWDPDPPRWIQDGAVIVDAGAMLGSFSVFMAAFVPGATVHAFEPMPANLRLLRRNARRWPQITVHPVALSDEPGWLEMAYEEVNRGHAAVVATDPWPRPGMVPFRARAVTLDSIELARVDLLKMDVEWHEPQVLAGAAGTIARHRPLILLEDWNPPSYAALLPGYRLARSWQHPHQLYLYEPVG